MKGTIKIENGYIEFIEKMYAIKNVRGNAHKLFLFIETRDQSTNGMKACICDSGILKLITENIIPPKIEKVLEIQKVSFSSL